MDHGESLLRASDHELTAVAETLTVIAATAASIEPSDNHDNLRGMIPIHVHPFAEFFYVLQGTVDAMGLDSGGHLTWISLGAGECMNAPGWRTAWREEPIVGSGKIPQCCWFRA